jgi:hypothetical protein
VSPVSEIPNWNVFLWALHELGGSDDFVDIEQVFWRCFELAPQRLSWRTRPDLPDFKKCAKALQEAEARRPPLLVKTGDTFGRQLSVHGQKWINANARRLRAQLKSGQVVQEPKRRPRSRMLAEAEQASAFAEWRVEPAAPIEKWKMAELLRCSPDSDVAVWRNRLATLRAAANAADRRDLLKFLDVVAATHMDWFGGDIRDET